MPVAAPAIAQASACMRCGRMPMSCAAVASSETASMRLPTAVRVRIRWSSSVIRSPLTPASTREPSKRMPSSTKEPPTSVSGRVLKSAPKVQKAA